MKQVQREHKVEINKIDEGGKVGFTGKSEKQQCRRKYGKETKKEKRNAGESLQKRKRERGDDSIYR